MNDASEQLTSAGHAAWSANATHEPASACGQGATSAALRVEFRRATIVEGEN